jgi:hypothetical protein
MEVAMDWIGNHAAFYRGYLTDDRSLLPLTIVLANGVALWLLIYLVSLVGPVPSTPSAVLPHAHATTVIVESTAR